MHEGVALRGGLALFASSYVCVAVLRFPDAGYDLRWPVSVEHCDESFPDDVTRAQPSGDYARCLARLGAHLREDLDCTAITPNNELYIDPGTLSYIYRTCTYFTDAFDEAFALASAPPVSHEDMDVRFQSQWTDFVTRQRELLLFGEAMVSPVSYANSTAAVVKSHTEAVVYHVAVTYLVPWWRDVLFTAVALAWRLYLLIENLSMTLLVNHLLVRLDSNGREDGEDYVRQLYGDISGRYVFHDLGPKRWDVLCHLLERLGRDRGGGALTEDPPRLRMVEIGVDTANVSARLLERYPVMLDWHVGVDPYFNKPNSTFGDSAHAATRDKLAAFGRRSQLRRQTSEEAAAALAGETFDLVFLDARHDHESVAADIEVWWPKVRRPGGVLAGHDFQWQYPGLPMAVTAGLGRVPIQPPRVVNLASDGMWWFDL